MFVHRRWRMDRSGGLRHAARVAAGIVRCRFDRGGRQWLRCVGKQLARIVGHRRIWIDARVRFRQWGDHGRSQPGGAPSTDPLLTSGRGVSSWVEFIVVADGSLPYVENPP
jgi:hypothetical protein